MGFACTQFIVVIMTHPYTQIYVVDQQLLGIQVLTPACWLLLSEPHLLEQTGLDQESGNGRLDLVRGDLIMCTQFPECLSDLCTSCPLIWLWQSRCFWLTLENDVSEGKDVAKNI